MLGWLRRRLTELSPDSRGAVVIHSEGLPDGYEPPSGSLTPPGDTATPTDGCGWPSVGRIVHYVSHGTPVRPDGSQAFTSECRTATISEVGGWTTTLTEGGPKHRVLHQVWNPDVVGLMVSNPTGLFFHPISDGGCRYDEGSGEASWSCDGRNHEGGTWHWPSAAQDR